MQQKKIYFIQNLLDDINKIIENSNIQKKHIQKLKNFFVMPQINDIDQYELLFCIDQNILKFIDYKFIKL